MVKLSDFLESQGMNYSVSKIPAKHDDLNGNTIVTPGQFHLQRDTDGLIVSPKTVSDGYQETDPKRYSRRVESFIQEGWITPRKGYTFKDGQFEVLSFAIDGGMLEDKGKVIGEDWDYCLNLSNGHGGRSNVVGSISCKRLRCLNGAFAIVDSVGFKFRHSGELEANLDSAIEQWEELRKAIRRVSDRMAIWNEKAVSEIEASSILDTLYGIEEGKETSTQTSNEREYAFAEWNNPDRGTFGKSLADIYNAITATNTHYSPPSTQKKGAKPVDPMVRLASLYTPTGSRRVFEAQTVSMLDLVAGIAR